LLGNSGNSDAPHLHFQLESKSNAFFGGEGMPYHIEKFTQLLYYSEDGVDMLLRNYNILKDSLNPIEKNKQFPVGFGLVEIK
jgi:murein DD-endopeptidase MepM/ murein hydrolase activator NlpD